MGAIAAATRARFVMTDEIWSAPSAPNPRRPQGAPVRGQLTQTFPKHGLANPAGRRARRLMPNVGPAETPVVTTSKRQIASPGGLMTVVMSSSAAVVMGVA